MYVVTIENVSVIFISIFLNSCLENSEIVTIFVITKNER